MNQVVKEVAGGLRELPLPSSAQHSPNGRHPFVILIGSRHEKTPQNTGLLKLPDRYTIRKIKHRIHRVPYLTRCFRRRENGRHIFERGEKPQQFGSAIPSQRAWSSFRRSANARNAICVARQFEEELERHGGHSYATVAERFGVSRAMVCYHIALLRRLPVDFVVWLEQEDDHTIWAYFTEHRLRPVTRIADQEEQVRQLAMMIDEARAVAGPASN